MAFGVGISDSLASLAGPSTTTASGLLDYGGSISVVFVSDSDGHSGSHGRLSNTIASTAGLASQHRRRDGSCHRSRIASGDLPDRGRQPGTVVYGAALGSNWCRARLESGTGDGIRDGCYYP